MGLCSSCFKTVDCQSCCYFRPSFVNCCPYNLLSGSTPPPLSCLTVQNTDSMWLGRVTSHVGDHILEESNTRIWPDPEPTKLLEHPKQSPRRGGGLRQINTCQKSLHRSIVLDDDILCLYINMSMIHPASFFKNSSSTNTARIKKHQLHISKFIDFLSEQI